MTATPPPTPSAGLPLLGPQDPPPFTLLNPEGTAPLLLVCDHASNAIPAALDGLGLPAACLGEHIAIDIGAAAVTRLLAARLNAPAVLCGYSRLVVDCNRQPGDPTAIPPVSDGVSIPGNRDLAEVEAQARTDAIFWPYHRAIGDTLAHLWRRMPATPPAVLAVHSFTPCLSCGGAPRPWHVGVLWNRDGRLKSRLIHALEQEPGLIVGDNQPYSGTTLSFTTEAHAAAAGLPHAGLEIRQDLIATPAGCLEWAERLARALDPLLGDPDLHRLLEG